MIAQRRLDDMEIQVEHQGDLVAKLQEEYNETLPG